MYRMVDEVGRHPGKEIGTFSRVMIDSLTSYAATYAASALGKARFVFRICFKSTSRFSSASWIFIATSPTWPVGRWALR